MKPFVAATMTQDEAKFSSRFAGLVPTSWQRRKREQNLAFCVSVSLFLGDDWQESSRAKAPRTRQDRTRDGGLILEPVGTAKAESLGNAMRRIGSESIVRRNCFTTVKGSACSEFHQKHS